MKAKASGLQKECAGCNYNLPPFHRIIQPLWRGCDVHPNSRLCLLFWPIQKQALVLYRTHRIVTSFQSSIKPLPISRPKGSKNDEETSVQGTLYSLHIWRLTWGCFGGGELDLIQQKGLSRQDIWPISIVTTIIFWTSSAVSLSWKAYTCVTHKINHREER